MTAVFSAVEIGQELADLGISAFVSSFLRAKASCNVVLGQEANSNSDNGSNDEQMVFIAQSLGARQHRFMAERRVG